MKNLTTLLSPSGIEKSQTLKKILLPILPLLNHVESKLKSIGDESEGILKDSSHYVLNGEGKRFRSALVLFCSLISDGSKEGASIKLLKNKEESSIEIAASVELIHAATLVHDDIVDRAVLRRLKPPVHLQFGEDVAVLLGDFLYSKAFRMIAEVGDTEMTLDVARTTQGMCEGELDQLKNRYRPYLTEQEYISFIERKTASLIAISASSGARLASLSSAHQKALAQFALNIGISYQIIDDLLDVIGLESKLGKTLRTDTGNGKMTLPMILLLRYFDKEEKEKFLKGFGTAQLDWEWMQHLITRHKIEDQTKQIADSYFNRAVESLKLFGPDVQEPLINLSKFVLNRDY